MKENNNNNLAIVILNYNDYELTIANVNKLIEQNVKYPIIIVDNQSLNDSYKILQDEFNAKLNIDVIQSDKNGGYSYGNNFGIKYAEKKYHLLDYICIMNPDITINDKYIFKNLINILESNEEYALATGVQKLDDKMLYGWDLPNYWKVVFGESIIVNFYKKIYSRTKFNIGRKNIITPDVISGCFFVIKLDVFKKVNYFDENVFLYYEENILSFKLKRLGLKCVIDLSQIFNHNHKHKKWNLKSLSKNYSVLLDSKIYYCKNYLDKRTIFNIYLAALIHKYIEIPFMSLVYSLKK